MMERTNELLSVLRSLDETRFIIDDLVKHPEIIPFGRRQIIVLMLKELVSLNHGVFIPGRRGNPSSFKLISNTKLVSTYDFVLRENHTVRLILPKDFSREEMRRFIFFIKSIEVQG